MKTLWNIAGPRFGVHFKGICLICCVFLGILTNEAKGAVTPISVSPGGVGPITFDTLPGLADGWSTASWAGTQGYPTNAAQMDAVVNTNNAASIATPLATDFTVTNATTMFGTAGGFRWNSPGEFLASRPAGNSYNVLLATLVNNTGADLSSFLVGYDYGLDLAYMAGIDEDPGASNGSEAPGQLAGFRVYYSLIGQPGSWVHIPQFDGTNAGFREALICLYATWVAGSKLYLLWCDDNAVNGSNGSTGIVEGPNALDNFVLQFASCLLPSITTQPHSVAVEVCAGTNLTVTVTGSSPTFQWFKDGSPITGATKPIYELPQATVADNGNYFVRVTGCCGGYTVQSESVTVTAAATSAKVVSSLLTSDLTTMTLSFTHPMDPISAQKAEYYSVRALDGGVEQACARAVLSTNRTDLTLTLAGPVTAAKHYELVINTNVSDCVLRPLVPLAEDGSVHAPLNYELTLISMTNTVWRISTNGIDLGTAWRSDPAYDDSAWPTGIGVFDGYSSGFHNSIGGLVVNTYLPLLSTNWNGTDDIPAFYFRTHFNLPADPARILSLNLFTLSDDFDVCWLNNRDTPVHIRNGFPPGTNVDQFYYSGGVAVGEAAREGPFVINPSLLKYGTNLIVAKQFQRTSTSPDITFAYELVAVVSEVAPRISISFDGANVHIRWPDGTMHLYEAAVPDAAPSAWTLVQGQTAGTATISGVSAQPVTAKFFSLRQ